MNAAAQSEARFEPESLHAPTVPRHRRKRVGLVASMVAFVHAALARLTGAQSEAAMLRRLRGRPSLLDGGPPRDGSAPYSGAERLG